MTTSPNHPPLSLLEAKSLAAPEEKLRSLGEALRAAAGGSGSIGYLEAEGFSRQSYAELLEEAEHILGGLRARGLKAGDKVILQLESNRDFIGVLWGCFLGGIVPAPLSVPPAYQTGQSAVAKLIKACELLEGAPIICRKQVWAEIEELGRQGQAGWKVETVEELRLASRDGNWHPNRAEDLALLLLTSGSTGQPKAVMLSHHNILCRSAATAQFDGFGPREVSLNWMPLDHVGGVVMFHLRDVYVGCEQIHAPTGLVLEEPLRWLDWMEKHKVSVTWAPNFAFGLINEQEAGLKARQRDLSRLRFILNGGEAIVSRTARRFLELLEPHGLRPDAMHPAWGMSETSSGITSSPRFRRDTTRDEDIFVEVGEALPGVSLRIVDGRGQLVPMGEIGSLQVRGLTVTRGYYRQDGLTREVFTPDGWFKTGDLAYIKNGQLTITGREKDVIIINGMNYYCHDLEAAAEEIPGVKVSFTAACPFRRPGEDTDLLVLFFSPAADAVDSLTPLFREIVARMVQKTGLRPDEIVALPKERIPKSAIGKIQRSVLRDQWLAGEHDAARLREGPAPGPDWFFRKTWRPEEIAPAGAKPGNVLLFADAGGIAAAVREEIGQRPAKSVLVYRGTEFRRRDDGAYEIDGRNPAHYLELWRSLAGDGFAFDAIGHFWTCGPAAGPPSSVAELRQEVTEATLSLLFLIQALARREKPEEEFLLMVASNQVQPVFPGDAVTYARTPLLGLLKTASDEIAGLNCRHVDLPPGATEVPQLAAELRNFEEKREVAYREGKRLVWGLEKVHVPGSDAAEPAVRRGGRYLVTGGLGGIGQAVARSLIERFDARLLLIGRSPLPSEGEADWAEDSSVEKAAAWTTLQALSPHVAYRAGAITDVDALSKIVAEMESQWQAPLDGIFHLAGSYHETLLAEETPEGLAREFEPKIYGTWALHQLAKQRPSSLFVGFSSLISAFGGYSAGAYSAANNFIDGFALYQRRETNVAGYAFLWSSWKETGMSRGVEARDALRARGYLELEPASGIDSLFGALAQPEPCLLVGLDGKNPRVRAFLSPEAAAGETTSAAENAAVEPHTRTERQLAKIWRELLKRPTIGIRDNFFEIGGKSLLAARMFARIHKEMGMSLPLATLFSFPTIEQLARALEGKTSSPLCRLVTIQPEGSELPLFCLPGGGSDAIEFRDLARELGLTQPLYGLQARGLDGTNEAGDDLEGADEYPNLEKLAGLLIAEMRKVQPRGPYGIVGHCFGGTVAYEMAQQLKAAGEELSVLALLDPTASEALFVGAFGAFWERVTYNLRKAFQRRPSELIRYLVERIQAYPKGMVVWHRLRHNVDRMRVMHDSYQIRPYPGRISVFLATDSRYNYRRANDPRRIWDPLALKGVDYYFLRGDHHTMLHENADDLAEKLKACLAAFAAQSPRANHTGVS